MGWTFVDAWMTIATLMRMVKTFFLCCWLVVVMLVTLWMYL